MGGTSPVPVPSAPRLARGVRLLAAALALLGGPRALAGQQQALRVTVVDSATRQPVPRVRVGVVDGPRALTGEDGGVLLEGVRPGAVVVEAELLGYARRRALVRVGPGPATAVEIAIAAVPLRLGGLDVTAAREVRTAWLRDFYARAEAGPGQYFTRADIDRMRPREVSDLFRVVPGMTLSVSPEGDATPQMQGGSISYRANRTGNGRGDGSTCPILWFMDGTPVEPPDGKIDVEIDPSEVEGIEIYRRTTMAPPQYRRGHANCGVVLIWKRERIGRT